MTAKPTKKDLEWMRDLAVEVVDKQQARLDAIAAILSICEYQDMGKTVIRELGAERVKAALVLARGTPRREVERALKRWRKN